MVGVSLKTKKWRKGQGCRKMLDRGEGRSSKGCCYYHAREQQEKCQGRDTQRKKGREIDLQG